MFIRTIACFFLVFMFAHADAFQNEEWNLLSPDKKVSVTVSNKSNQLHYTVSYEKRVAVESSQLGMVRDDQQF